MAALRRVAGAAGLLAALAICGVAILDPDLPWHLSAARGMLAAGCVPHHDWLSWTMTGKPWIDFEWGSELIFYGLERLGGSPALWLFRSAALFGVVLLFWSLLRLWKIPRIWGALAAPALAAALFPLYGLRPEIFSTLLFLLELHLLERRRLGELRLGAGLFAALHFVFYAVWTNLHAGFPVGLLLCLCYGAGEAVERREARVPAPILAGAAGFLGTFLNPYGAQVYAVLFDHWRHLGLLRRIIVEWTPPSFGVKYLTGYWILLAFSFAGLFLAFSRGVVPPVEHVVVIAAFGIFGSRSIRTTKFVLLTVYPMALAVWSRLELAPRRLRALGLSALVAVAFIAWRGYSWAGRLRFFGWPAPMEAQGPARAFDFLRKEKATLAGLKLYNPYNWGGALGYALFPAYKVFIDGRYIFADLIAEIDEAQGDPQRWRAFMDGRGIDLVLTENDGLILRYPGEPIGRPYAAYAWPKAEWALVYWDADAIILVRRSAVSPFWLAGHEFRWIRPHDLHEVGLYLVAGVVPLKTVEAEVDRYRREIGDPRETLVLTSWLAEFKKGLGARGAYK